jgi:hypothetical protein
MVARVLLEVVAGIGFLIWGVYYFRSARARCERMRADARARAERASPRWRWFFYPRSWYETGQDLLAIRSSALGMILFGIVFLVLAGLTAFDVHP